ncbi:MAG TPA: deacetylase, partial [Burkholderiales bacterium]
MSQGFDAGKRIAFVITIDTEGDNLWEAPREITTRNAAFLPRFQSLCEKHGLKPTYLTNWEMANAPAFVEFGRDVLARNAGEIGMHLHAWNSPPVLSLTADDFRHQPYLIEYPEAVLRNKVRQMTDCLESKFQTKMRSHRAGRWSFDPTYAKALAELGYEVDCSVTPHHSWRGVKGDPDGAGGTDFTDYPETAYFLDLSDLTKRGSSGLLEVPMTILPRRYSSGVRLISAAARKVPVA